MDSIILLVAMIAVFYFLIIRPENKRKKQAENMRNSLKKGERITTIGGLVGRPRRLTRRRRRLRKSLRPRKRPRLWPCRLRTRRKRLKSPRISPLTILRSSKIDNCIA